MSNLLNDQHDNLWTRDQNFHGRRIRNAADAIEPGDYVTLRQLQNRATSFSTVYTLFVEGILAIGSDLALRPYVVSGGPVLVFRASVELAPVGKDVVFDVYQNNVFWATGKILAGTDTWEASVFPDLTRGTELSLDITSVGDTTPGTTLVVTIGV